MRYFNIIQILSVVFADCNLYANRKDDSIAIIHMAAEAGDISCVAERLTAGDDPNLKTAKGSSVLHFAYQGRHAQELGFIDFFINSYGAHIDALIIFSLHSTPYCMNHIKPKKNIDEVSKLLIDNGADIKSANDKGWEPAHIIYQNPRLSDDTKLDLISKLTDLNSDIPKSLPWYTINIMGYQIPILPPPQRLSPKLKDAIQSLGVIPTSDGNEIQKEDDIEKEITNQKTENFENSEKMTQMSENLENTLRKNFELGNQISSLNKEKSALNAEKEQLGEKIVGLSKEKDDLEANLKSSRSQLEAQKEESKNKMNEMEQKMKSEIDSLKNQIRQELKNKVDASIQTDKVRFVTTPVRLDTSICRPFFTFVSPILLYLPHFEFFSRTRRLLSSKILSIRKLKFWNCKKSVLFVSSMRAKIKINFKLNLSQKIKK